MDTKYLRLERVEPFFFSLSFVYLNSLIKGPSLMVCTIIVWWNDVYVWGQSQKIVVALEICILLIRGSQPGATEQLNFKSQL